MSSLSGSDHSSSTNTSKEDSGTTESVASSSSTSSSHSSKSANYTSSKEGKRSRDNDEASPDDRSTESDKEGKRSRDNDETSQDDRSSDDDDQPPDDSSDNSLELKANYATDADEGLPGYLQNDFTLTGTRAKTLIGSSAACLVGTSIAVLFGPTVNKLGAVSSFTLSPVLKALLIASPTCIGALGRIPAGMLVEKFGTKRLINILLGISSVAILGLLIALAILYPARLQFSHYALLFILGAIAGAGVSIFVVSAPEVAFWYPKKDQGLALGILGGLNSLGPGIFTIVVPFLLTVIPLWANYLIWLVINLIGLTVHQFLSDDSAYFQVLWKLEADQVDLPSRKEAAKIIARKHFKQEVIPRGSASAVISKAAKNYITWLLVFSYFFSFGGYLALTNWFNTYYVDYHNQSATIAGVIAGCYAILSALAKILGGLLADKFGGEIMCIFSALFMLLGSLILSFCDIFWLCIVASLIMAVGGGTHDAAVFMLVAKYLSACLSGASSIVGCVGAFGGFLLPPVLGAIVQSIGNEGFRLEYLVFSVASVIIICMQIYLLVRDIKEKKKTLNAEGGDS